MNRIKSKFVTKSYSSSKSEDETNGLILNDIAVPGEIILMIFNYADIKTVLRCRQVCKNWKEFVESHHFWRMRLAHKNKVIKPKHDVNLPWYAYYVCYKMLDKNLLRNGNGQNKMKYWRDIEESGDGWRIENPPHGADELPQNQLEFNDMKSCFATSYGLCSKRQTIKLKKNCALKKILNEYQPTIYVSEWFAGRFDCGCVYTLGVRIYERNKIVFEKEERRTIQQWTGRAWEKVEIKCENYGKDIDCIEFYHSGQDTQFWAGHYGSKMAGGVVKILFDFL